MLQFYLRQRLSLAFHSNFSLALEDDSHCKKAVPRAAQILIAVLQFYHDAIQGIFPASDRSAKISGDQYLRLFSTSRIPGDFQSGQVDDLLSSPASFTVTIACQGQFYILALPHPKDGLPSLESLERVLNTLVLDALESKPEPCVGALTALPRNDWALFYKKLGQQLEQKLGENPLNREGLRLIQTSLFFMALDIEPRPLCNDSLATSLAQGDIRNRWFDRSHQWIICENGSAGINCEHSAIDGEPAAHYLSDVFLRCLKLRKKDFTDPLDHLRNPFGNPLEFRMEFKKIRWSNEIWINQAVEKAITFASDQMRHRNLTVIESPFGTDFYQSHPLPADSVIQLAIQVVLSEVFNDTLVITESISMRHHPKGRYDTLLTVTPESKAFVQSFLQDRSRNHSWTSSSQQLQGLLKRAIQAHRDQIRNCKKGLNPLQTHEFLLYHVTTSNGGSQPGVALFSFTDTEPGILGIAYLVKANQTIFTVKSEGRFLEQTSIFEDSLQKAMIALAQLTSSQSE